MHDGRSELARTFVWFVWFVVPSLEDLAGSRPISLSTNHTNMGILTQGRR